LLYPALSVLDGGSMPREAFTRLYRESLCTLSAARDNRPDPSVCQ
jgi:hypothetical protein